MLQRTAVTRVLFDGVLATCFGMERGGNLKGTLLCRTEGGSGVGVGGRRQKLNYSTEGRHVWTSGTDTEMNIHSFDKFILRRLVLVSHTPFRSASHR